MASQPLLRHALPLRERPASPDLQRGRRSNGPQTSILLVDDQPAFRSAARCMFEKGGVFRVVGEAADGADAVRLAGEHAPDVVVMDIRMPVMTGIEAARRILARRPETSVVLISMAAESEYPRLARQVGARAFITKRDLSAATLQGAMRSGPLSWRAAAPRP